MTRVDEIRERAEKEIAVWKDLAPKGKPWHFRTLSKQWTVQEVAYLLDRIAALEAVVEAARAVHDSAEQIQSAEHGPIMDVSPTKMAALMGALRALDAAGFLATLDGVTDGGGDDD